MTASTDWRYYRHDRANDVWVLFRLGDDAEQQVYRFGSGWTPTTMAWLLACKGELDETDRVTEGEARRILVRRSEDPDRTAPPQGEAAGNMRSNARGFVIADGDDGAA